MRKQSAVDFFGSQAALAEILAIKPAAVSQWGEVIPEKQAFRLERLTDGELLYQSGMYQKDQVAQSREDN